MTGKLKQHFPMIYEREDLLRQIEAKPALRQRFDSWGVSRQKEFLDFCTGVRGTKLLYDSFFKEILNPEYTPERLNRLLSVLLGRHVTIKHVLPGDSTRIADEGSLLIMDIIVQLDDGSLADVEAQKIGYAFPGQRSACYSADLLLRQYKRIRDEQKKKFSYLEIKEVYTIVFIEESTGEFRKFPGEYLHYFEQRSNTGIRLDLLQKYLFIPLDIFGWNIQNKDISNETEAWLAFLSQDDPEIILRLIDTYPEFRSMYEDVYRLCQNVERVMEMFSEELRILDRNTVQYMIDEMQAEIDNQKSEIDHQKAELASRKSEIDNQKAELASRKSEIDHQKAQLQEKDRMIRELERRIAELEKQPDR